MSTYYSPKVVSDGLVVCLDAANSKSYIGSGTSWNDLSGNNNTGTLVNGPTYTSSFGGSIVFDGTNDYVSEYSIPDSFWNAGSWTANVWVKFTTVSKGIDNAIFGHGFTGTSNGLHLAERSSRVYFGFYSNDTGGNIPLSANIWYNIVWVFNYSTKLKQIYVNGVFDTSGGTVGYGGTGTNTEIGRYPWSPSYIMSGNIAVTSLYNRVLSASEILQNYNANKGRFAL